MAFNQRVEQAVRNAMDAPLFGVVEHQSRRGTAHFNVDGMFDAYGADRELSFANSN